MGIFTAETDYFGLDIGETALRLVQLKKGGAKPVLVTLGDVALPSNLLATDSTTAQDKLAVLIKQLHKDLKVTSKNAVVGLPASKVFASVITTPKLNDIELAKAIKYQADQYVPMAIDQVKLDWTVLGPGKTENELEVLLVACPNTVAEKYLNILTKAELEVSALEVNATALYRAMVPTGSPAVIVLDIGSLTTDLSLIYQDTPRLIRSIAVGGNTFVKTVSTALGLDEVQADQFVRKFGLTQTKLEGQVYKALKPNVDILVDEIGKSIKFFTTRYTNVKVEKIVLTGGAAATLELPAYIANATRLPVELGNAWINVSYPASMQEKLLGLSHSYGVATGLAQRMFV
jgi:type IV pilus assembly protein PilM